ncbi:hypothetical protein HDU76_013795 [Blyttiomyces sp. JEL0837]|nr:hypothetical protein HDU76_013795 [Blyttiomyces sp. JEL0837]
MTPMNRKHETATRGTRVRIKRFDFSVEDAETVDEDGASGVGKMLVVFVISVVTVVVPESGDVVAVDENAGSGTTAKGPEPPASERCRRNESAKDTDGDADGEAAAATTTTTTTETNVNAGSVISVNDAKNSSICRSWSDGSRSRCRFDSLSRLPSVILSDYLINYA